MLSDSKQTICGKIFRRQLYTSLWYSTDKKGNFYPVYLKQFVNHYKLNNSSQQRIISHHETIGS